MELKSSRYGYGALLLAAVLLPLRHTARTLPPPEGIDNVQRLNELEFHEHAANIWWAAADERDAAIDLVAHAAVSDSIPAIELRGFAAGAIAPDAASLVAGTWQKIGAPQPHVHVAVVLANMATYHFARFSGAWITRRNGETWCVALTPGGQSRAGEIEIRTELFVQALAPCALLATFGPPGPAVAAWLDSTRYVAARSDNWLTKPRDYTDREGPWLQWQPESARHGVSSLAWMEFFGAVSGAQTVTPPYNLGASGLRCITGDQASCVRSVLHPDLAVPPPGTVAPDLTLSANQLIPDTVGVATTRPATPALVSGMISDFGREKFRRFWTSTRPFEQAFAEAFGEPLGAWTARWSAREWRAMWLAQFGNPDIQLGVTLRPVWPLLVIGWSGCALLVAGVVARRRTVA